MKSITTQTIDVSIIIDGQAATVYQKNGRYFIEGKAGKSYLIRVRNLTSHRLEILESVDGRDVLADQAAALSNRGMIVNRYYNWDNHGWRINDHETRDFVFGRTGDSIAARSTGSAAGVGVVGIAVFNEKPYRPRWEYTTPKMGSFETSSTNLRSLSSVTADMAADLGTGIGASREDRVGRTEFERAGPIPAIVIEIQYRSLAWLVEQAVITPDYPSAFPAAFSETGYGKY